MYEAFYISEVALEKQKRIKEDINEIEIMKKEYKGKYSWVNKILNTYLKN